MKQHTILIVEDEVDIRESLQDAFEDAGYVVRCAANGLEALDALRQVEPPCVVVLDLIMPIMTGRELYETMQADPKLARIPVVVSTSDPSRAPTGVPLIRKPIDLRNMLTVVAKYC